MRFLRKWLQARSRTISDTPSKMQKLIDSEMGHQPMAYESRDCYRRLSEVPGNNDSIEWTS